MVFKTNFTTTQNNVNDEWFEYAKQECIENLINRTKLIHKDLTETYIRNKVENKVNFKIFDTRNANTFIDINNHKIFNSLLNDGKCAVFAEYELEALNNV